MHVMETFNTLVVAWIGIGLATFLALVVFRIRAPYGRHARKGWGRMIDNHWGWFWMELPALIIMPVLSLIGPSAKTPTLLLLTGLWVLHYAYRTLVFPFQLRTKGKKMPISIVLSAIFFNLVNGFLNGYFLGWLAPSAGSVFSIHASIGLVLFFGGAYINQRADRKLIGLRKNGNGYQVPKGWLFTYISCPNHFGEIIEWAGFALIAWNLPALSFALWTFFNLVPRSLNHHAWYREHFPEYPKGRKAVIPYILI